MEKITGRFAPTPSGEMHLGNLYCAMAAFLAARSCGGKFIVRMEDNDIPRCRKEYAEDILACLSAFGFTWDEPVIYQSQRGEIYSHALFEIRQHTYPCFCTREEILRMDAPHLGDTQRLYSGKCRSLSPKEAAEKTAEMAAQGRIPAVRLRVPDEEIAFTDMVQGEIRENLARECGDFVLRRTDGIWGYQLCSTVDDMLQGVNQVVRGRDILTSTPRQIYLRQLLGGGNVEYAHIPLLLDSSGKRLAKRDSSLSLKSLLRQHKPEEVIGFLAYSAGIVDDAAPRTLESLIPGFSLNRLPGADMRLSLRLQ